MRFLGSCGEPKGIAGQTAGVHSGLLRSSLRQTTTKEEAMKYVLLIHQGTTPVPGTDAWNELSEDEQKEMFAGYGAINETPGVTPNNLQLDSPQTATTVRVEDGETL